MDRKMAQWVDEQALIRELSSSAIHVKAGGVGHACTPSAKGNGKTKIPGVHWPASLASTVSSSSARPLTQNLRWND